MIINSLTLKKIPKPKFSFLYLYSYITDAFKK